MKSAFVLAVSLVSSFAFAAPAQKVFCKDSTSELTFVKANSARKITGEYHYNKNSQGEFTSFVGLECDVTPLNNWDFVDCMDTGYGGYYSMYQLPKNVFALKPGTTFAIVELMRNETFGDIYTSRTFENCVLQ